MTLIETILKIDFCLVHLKPPARRCFNEDLMKMYVVVGLTDDLRYSTVLSVILYRYETHLKKIVYRTTILKYS